MGIVRFWLWAIDHEGRLSARAIFDFTRGVPLVLPHAYFSKG